MTSRLTRSRHPAELDQQREAERLARRHRCAWRAKRARRDEWERVA